ncbi:MAG: hypothetical protein AMXMBFR33_13530 [Candidatus Xenobia bacterium]
MAWVLWIENEPELIERAVLRLRSKKLRCRVVDSPCEALQTLLAAHEDGKLSRLRAIVSDFDLDLADLQERINGLNFLELLSQRPPSDYRKQLLDTILEGCDPNFCTSDRAERLLDEFQQQDIEGILYSARRPNDVKAFDTYGVLEVDSIFHKPSDEPALLGRLL